MLKSCGSGLKHRGCLQNFSHTRILSSGVTASLYLNRQSYQSNYKVARTNGQISLTPVSSQEDLYDITFKMLGSSAEDHFFPNNFLIVEGATDQIIANKIMELKGIDHTKGA